MAERQTISRPEIASQKRVIKLPPAIGDWTTYKPAKVLARKVKSGLYGFDRLSRDELDQVLKVHYSFLQQFTRSLKIDLKMAVEFFSAQVEQTTYLNFLRTLSGPVIQLKLTLPEIHESAAIFVDLALANSMVNYALGSYDLEPINRSFTEAENQTFLAALAEYLPLYAQAFGDIFENPSISIIGSPEVTIDQSVSTSATFVSFSAEIALADNPPGKILIGYQGSSLKNLMGRYKQNENLKPLDFSRLPSALLSLITIPARVVLGETHLNTGEILQLEVGDVVSTENPIDASVTLNLGKKLEFLCQPGIKDKKISVRVAGINAEEESQAPPLPVLKAPLKEPEIMSPLPELPTEKEEEEFEEELPEEEALEDFEEEEFEEGTEGEEGEEFNLGGGQ